MAVWVPSKGADEYAVKSIRMLIQTLGFPNGIIQSDSEHSALAVRKDGAADCQSLSRDVEDRTADIWRNEEAGAASH
eukprot:200448-Amphidinium_carterae.4